MRRGIVVSDDLVRDGFELIHHHDCKIFGVVAEPPCVMESARPDVVADVFLIDQQLVNRSARPFPAKIGANAAGIEIKGDFGLAFTSLDKAPVSD